MNPKISVIIPAYNAEKTLRRCLDSVFASDFLESMEVILVNDGSKDGTLEVAEEYWKFPNFVLIDQPNGGVARARWSGISASRGEYLGFVDADDYIAPDMMSKMYSKIRSTMAQICICGFFLMQEEHAIETQDYEEIEIEKNEASIKKIINNKLNSSLWNKIFDRKLIKEENLSKTVGISYGEDLLLLYFALRRAEIIAYLAERLYFYVANPDSVTNRPSVKSLKDRVFAHELLCKQMIDNEFPRLKTDSQRFYMKALTSTLRILAGKEPSSEAKILQKEICRRIKSIKLHEILALKKNRITFDYFLICLNLFVFVYSFWESDFFTPCRKLWRHYRNPTVS